MLSTGKFDVVVVVIVVACRKKDIKEASENIC